MVNDKIDKFIAGVAKIESWVRHVCTMAGDD